MPRTFKIISRLVCFSVSAAFAFQSAMWAKNSSNLFKPIYISYSSIVKFKAISNAHLNSSSYIKLNNQEEITFKEQIANLEKKIESTKPKVVARVKSRKVASQAIIKDRSKVVVVSKIDLKLYELNNQKNINKISYLTTKLDWQIESLEKLASTIDIEDKESSVKVASHTIKDEVEDDITTNASSLKKNEAQSIQKVDTQKIPEVQVTKATINDENDDQEKEISKERIHERMVFPTELDDESVTTQNQIQNVDPEVEELNKFPKEVKDGVSNRVSDAIKRTALSMPTQVSHKQIEKDESIQNNSDDDIYVAYNSADVTTQKNSTATPKDESSLEEPNEDSRSGFLADNLSQINVSLKSVNLLDGSSYELKGFELAPEYDRNLRWSDEGSGIFKLSMQINSNNASTRMSALHSEIVYTRSEAVSFIGQSDFEIVTFNRESFEKFLVDQQLDVIQGGYLLVRMDESVRNVEIASDHPYKKAVMFTDDFKLTDDLANTEYVLFIGVKPGNILLQSISDLGEPLDKIVPIYPDELTYEFLRYKSQERQTLEIRERNVLGLESSKSTVEERELSLFNRKSTASKIGPGAFEMERPLLPFGMRRLVEAKHYEDTIYISSWDKEIMDIPSSDYISLVFGKFGINSLEDQCMLQFNFKKAVASFTYSIEGINGGVASDIVFLDSNGKDNGEVSEKSISAFILGTEMGMVNARIDYTDSTTDSFTSVCAPGTYFVEQN